MSIELMKRALEFITGVYFGEHEGSRADREKLEADLTTAIQQAEAPQPDNAACKSVQKRLEAQQPATGEPVAWMHWLNGPVRVFMNKDVAMMELDRLNREYPLDADDRKMRPLVFGDTAPQPATGEPVAWLDEMLADTREVFDAGGSETPQVVRDVIEYVASWVTVYSEKNRPAPSVPADVVRVPLQVMKDASEALGNFVSDHGWGDADMQAMDNLDAYIARHEAIDAAMLAAK